MRPGTFLTCRALHKRQLEVVFEDVPDRLPVHAGGLHRDMRDACAASQSRSAIRPCTVVVNSATSGSRRPSGVGHPHARGHLRLVDIQRADALKDRLHRPSSDRSPTERRPPGPSKQTSLMGVLIATVRDPGEGPRTKLTTGAQAPRTTRRQRATPSSSRISPARGWPKATTTNAVVLSERVAAIAPPGGRAIRIGAFRQCSEPRSASYLCARVRRAASRESTRARCRAAAGLRSLRWRCRRCSRRALGRSSG